jgi:hypothetical protein
MIKWHSCDEIPVNGSTSVILILKNRIPGCVLSIITACWEDCTSDSHDHDMAFVIECPIIKLGMASWSSCEKDSGCLSIDDIDGWISFKELESLGRF